MSAFTGVKFEGFYKGLVQARGRVNNLGAVKLEKYKMAIRHTLHLLLEASPQWSGYYASNWRVSFSGVTAGTGGLYLDTAAEAGFDRFKLGGDFAYGTSWGSGEQSIRQRGDLEAITFAKKINEPLIDRIPSISTRVVFKNATPYAKQIALNKLDPGDASMSQEEAGKAGGKFLRPVNVVSPTPIPIAYAKMQMDVIARILR